MLRSSSFDVVFIFKVAFLVEVIFINLQHCSALLKRPSGISEVPEPQPDVTISTYQKPREKGPKIHTSNICICKGNVS